MRYSVRARIRVVREDDGTVRERGRRVLRLYQQMEEKPERSLGRRKVSRMLISGVPFATCWYVQFCTSHPPGGSSHDVE